MTFRKPWNVFIEWIILQDVVPPYSPSILETTQVAHELVIPDVLMSFCVKSSDPWWRPIRWRPNSVRLSLQLEVRDCLYPKQNITNGFD